MNKRGQGGLSMDTIIIAIIGIIVLLLIVTFFTGGMSTIFGKIKNVFSGGAAGYDIDLAKTNCQDYCRRAIDLKQDAATATYCSAKFNIDKNNDGTIGEGEEGVYCKDVPGVSCSGGPACTT